MSDLIPFTFTTETPMPTRFWLDFVRYAKTIGADFEDGRLILTGNQLILLKIWWKEHANA